MLFYRNIFFFGIWKSYICYCQLFIFIYLFFCVKMFFFWLKIFYEILILGQRSDFLI